MSRRNTVLLLALLALLMPALACGASTVTHENIPMATLPPGTPSFTVAAVTTEGAEAFAGKTGQMLWQDAFPHVDQVNGLLSDGILYRSADRYPVLTALRAADGATLWQLTACGFADERLALASGLAYITCISDPSVPHQFPTPTPGPSLYPSPSVNLTPYATPTPGSAPHATPTFSPPPIIQQYISDTLYALDAKTGRVRWQASGVHFRALSGSLVIAQWTNGLVALSADSGKPVWTHPVFIRQHTQNEPPFSFQVATGSGFVAYSPDGAHVEALRASDGHLLWRGDIPQQTLDGVWDWSVAAITPSVTIASGERGLVVFDNATGLVRWQRTVALSDPLLTVAVSDDEHTVYAGYEAANSLYVAQQLSAIDAETGTLRWQNTDKFNSRASLGLRFSNSVVYVADRTRLTVLGANDGAIRWHDTVNGPVLSLSINAAVICLGTGQSLYLFNARDGREVWKAPFGSNFQESEPQTLILF
jgi:outer membrane protein assembly factor BamB